MPLVEQAYRPFWEAFMQARVPDGIEAAKITGVSAELTDTDVLVDCAEFDVGLAWEALRAAQEIYGAIACRTVRSGRVFLEPNAN
jgi:hypothetical protein